MALDTAKLLESLDGIVAKAREDAAAEATAKADAEKAEAEKAAAEKAAADGDGDGDGEGDGVAKGIETLTKQLGIVATVLVGEDGTSGLKGSVDTIGETLAAQGAALEKTLERVEALESRGAIRKSAPADAGDNSGGNKTEAEIAKSASDQLYAGMNRIGKAAFEGGRGVLTLT